MTKFEWVQRCQMQFAKVMEDISYDCTPHAKSCYIRMYERFEDDPEGACDIDFESDYDRPIILSIRLIANVKDSVKIRFTKAVIIQDAETFYCHKSCEYFSNGLCNLVNAEGTELRKMDDRFLIDRECGTGYMKACCKGWRPDYLGDFFEDSKMARRN